MAIIGSQANQGGTIVRGPNTSEGRIDLTVQDIVREVTVGDHDLLPSLDVIWRHTYTVTQVPEVQISVANIAGPQHVRFQSLAEKRGVVDASGRVRAIDGGTFDVVVRTPWSRRTVSVTLPASTTFATRRHESFVAGTLGAYLYDTLAPLVEGLTPSEQIRWPFKDGSDYSQWNPDCFGYPADLTGKTAGSTSGAFVHPRIMVSANHTGQPFAGQGYTVRDYQNAGHYSGGCDAISNYGDIRVARFPAAVPDFGVNKILPADWANYLPNLATSYNATPRAYYPILRYAGEATGPYLCVEALTSLHTYVELWPCPAHWPSLRAFSYNHSGDSGHPIGMPKLPNGDSILLGIAAFTLPPNYQTHFGGYNLVAFKSQVDGLMNTHIPGAALVEADLSAFTRFD